MNSELYDKKYKLPPEILKHIEVVLTNNPTGDGVRRAKFILKNGEITYQMMKRIKNFFDHFDINGNKKEYELAGGNLMKNFIEKTLITDRDAVERGKEIKRDANANLNNAIKAQKPIKINEYDAVNDAVNDAVKKNAIGIIVNDDNQILLLKRSNDTDWHPNKWALVGGAVEEGETPIEACKREIKEETNLNINKFNKKFTIQRNPDSIEHIFVAKFDGEPIDIKLNSEHTKYGWYSPEEFYFLNHVPNLVDYVNIAFKKYD